MKIANRVALSLVRVLPLAFLGVVPGFREGRFDFAAIANRVPAAVIKMQMGINDDIDLVRGDARGMQII